MKGFGQVNILPFLWRLVLRRSLCSLAVLIVFPVLSWVSSAPASSIRTISLEELSSMSSVVVQGTVKHVLSVWAPDGSDIYTYVTLRVGSTLKGRVDRPGAHIIRFRGGRVGPVVSMVKGAPVFRKGERVVLFLTSPDQEGFPRVLGLAQGKWTIKQGKVVCTGRMDRRPAPVRVTSPVDNTVQPVVTMDSGQDDRQDLRAFLRRVEAYVNASTPKR